MTKTTQESTYGQSGQVSTGQSFIQGALILTVSTAIVKIIGAVFKIPLANIIGTEGMGYFSTAYNLYNPIFTLATAGFPIAISRMVSASFRKKRYRDIKQIHKAAARIFMITGFVGFALMFFGTFIYTQIIHNPNARYAMLALSPAILFSCLSSIYRGYYEGLRNMFPTAISEIIEATCKLLLGLSSAYVLLMVGMNQYKATGMVFGVAADSADSAKSIILPYAAASAILGITIGSFISFIFLMLRHKIKGDGIQRYNLRRSPVPMPLNDTIKYLIRIAIPIGLGALVVNIAGFIDSTFLQIRLGDIINNHPGYLQKLYGSMFPNISDSAYPNSMVGSFNFASTLFMLIPAITQAFGVSALPSVTSAWTGGNRTEIKKSIETVIRASALFTIPAGLGLAVLSKPIVSLLYPRELSAPLVSEVLVIMGIGAIFSSMCTPINSMLQAIGRVDLPVKLLSIGLVIKIALNYTLVGIPEINIQGAGVGTLVCYAFITVAALYYLCREAKIVPNFVSIFIKPFIAALFCVAAAYASQGLLSMVIPPRIATIACIVVAVVIYVIALILLKAITKEDILMLPKGQKIAKLLEKRKWIG